MIDIRENYSLKPHTSFKIGGPAKYFCEVYNVQDIAEALAFAEKTQLEWFILGGGSNTVISDNGYSGLIIAPIPKGIEIVEQNDNEVLIDVASGENWDEFVQYAIANDLWGIENLSYVPGNVGAFAVQNVGAYGQEASETVVHVEAYDTQSKELKVILNSECGFYYRHSIFNTLQKGRFIILKTRLRLFKFGTPNLTYPDLQKKYQTGKTPSLQDIRNSIIEIRNQKYPYPTEARGGSVGSFFQNPLLSNEDQDRLDIKISENFPLEIQKSYQDLKAKFQSKKTGLKVSAFLIDICGLKGTVFGGAIINPNQPLVVLNTGNATAEDVLGLASIVRNAVFAKTGIVIPIEPELIGFKKPEIEHYLSINQ